MPSVRESTVRDYFSVLVVKYVKPIQEQKYVVTPTITMRILKKGDKNYSIRASGRAWKTHIVIMDWVLADKEEALSTVRHEIAHVMTYWQHVTLERVMPHGKEFKANLRTVSPRSWRWDLHWHSNEAIVAAQAEKAGRIRRIIPLKAFLCLSHGCRILHYGKRRPHFLMCGCGQKRILIVAKSDNETLAEFILRAKIERDKHS